MYIKEIFKKQIFTGRELLEAIKKENEMNEQITENLNLLIELCKRNSRKGVR